MKKRLLSVLLVLALVLSMVPVSVTAADVHTPGTHTQSSHCQKCNKTVTWSPWSKTTTPPTSGHYYLTEDVTLSNQVVASDLCLCLNGYTITGAQNNKTFAVAAADKYIAIMDCTATVVNGQYKAGGITGGKNTSTAGGTIYVGNANNKLYFYDGIIENNQAYSGGAGIAIANSSSTTRYGTVYMYGGEIRNNTAKNASGTYVNGGGIFVGNNGKCYVTGGKITGNEGLRGGGIYVGSNATVAVKNASVTGNHATELGGGVYMETGVLSLQEEAIITGNTAVEKTTANNVFLSSAATGAVANTLKGNAKIGVTLSGPRISAGTMNVTTAAAGTDAKYFESDNGDYEPKLVNNQVVLEKKQAPVQPHTHNGCNDTACTEHAAVTYEPWGDSAKGEDKMLPTSGSYYLTSDITVTNQAVMTADLNLCLNGHSITADSTKSTKRILASVSGYTLTIADCQAKVENGVYTAGKLTGAISTASNGMGGAINIGANDTLYLFDGIITGNRTYVSGGAVQLGGTMYMYGGEISGNIAKDGNDAGKAGGAICMGNNAKLYAYGGSIKNNQAKIGAAIYAGSNATIHLQDVEITGNTATETAGGVTMTTGTLTVAGETKIIDNTAAGIAQNVVLLKDVAGISANGLSGDAKIGVTLNVQRIGAGKMNLTTGANADLSKYFESDDASYNVAYDGEVKLVTPFVHEHCSCGDVTCTAHGAVSFRKWDNGTKLPDSGEYVLTTDVEITKQTVLTGDLTLCLNGKTITGFQGGRILAANGGYTLTICDCQAKVENGVYTAGKLTGAVHSAASNNSGGAIYVGQNDTLKLYDGILTKNQAYGGGGAVNVAGTMYMYGGEISGNSAMGAGEGREGGAIYVNKTGKAYLLGGTISGNDARVGGGVYCLGSQLEIANTKILNNTASKTAGGVFLADNTVVTLSGDTQVLGNTVAGAASNLILPDKVTLALGTMGQNAKVSVNASAFRFISGKTEDCTAAFQSDVVSLSVVYKDGKLYMDAADGHKHCLCNAAAEGCDHTAVKWAPWESSDSLPTSGNYYLTSDVTVNGQTTLDGTTLNLCLNGHTVKTTKRRVYYTKGDAQLSITDCTGKGVITGATESAIMTENNEASKPVVNVFGGNFKENTTYSLGGAIIAQGSVTLNIYGGTFEKNTSEGKLKVDANGKPVLDAKGNQQANNAIGGAAVGIYSENGVLNIYGGTFKDNETKHVECKNADGSVTNKGGYGVIYSKGIVNVKGGTFEGGKALLGGAIFVTGQKAVLTVSGGTISGNEAKGGGAIVIQSKATANLTGGKITGNKADVAGGGAIYVSDSTLNVADGEITNNTSTANGGAVFVASGTAQIKGGKITGNKAIDSTGKAGCGAAIYVNKSSAVQLLGGTISGNEGRVGAGVYSLGTVVELAGVTMENNKASAVAGGVFVADTTAIKLSGDTKILGNSANGKASNLVLSDKQVLEVGTMGKNAKVSVNASAFRFISGKTEDCTAAFQSDVVSLSVVYKDGKLYMDAADGHKHCLCNAAAEGCDHTAVKWAPWESSDSLPTSGNYYLTSDVTVNGQTTLDGTTLNLCLNGHTVKTTKRRVYYTKGDAQLSITDCTGKGVITGATESAIMTENNEASKPVVNVFGGNFKENTTYSLGGAIIAQGSVTLNIYGGTFEKNTSEGKLKVDANGKPVLDAKGNQQANNAIGGAAVGIYSENGVLNIYGGTFKDNKTTHVECKNADGSVTNKGGYGVIYSKGIVNVKGGTFEGGQALLGGGIFVTGNKAVLTVSGGTFTGNTAKGGGAIVAFSGATVNISGGTFAGNTAGAAGGGMLYISSGTKLQVAGGQFTGNHSGSNGGAMYIGESATADLTGGEISGNTATVNGAGVYVNRATAVFNGIAVKNNASEKGNGGGIYGAGATLIQIDKSEISGNTALNGAGIYATQNQVTKDTLLFSTVIVNEGAVISGNKAETNCGGLMLVGKESVLTLNGGTITGNSAKNGGGVLAQGASTVNMKGGKITGNKASVGGGGMYISADTTLNMEGGAISNNDSENNGGGMLVQRGYAKFTGGTISGNTATTAAGVYFAGGKADIYNVSITGNTARKNCGGILLGANAYTKNGVKVTVTPVVTMHGGSIDRNAAPKANAGGVLVQSKDSLFVMKGGSISNNTCSVGGGGIYAAGDTKIQITGGTISGNEAKQGGAIFCHRSDVTVTGGTLCNNTATGAGGAMYVNGFSATPAGKKDDTTIRKGIATVKNAELYGNKAVTGGAFEVINFGTLNLENVKVHDNVAENIGGGVYINKVSYGNLKNVKIYNNEAQTGGGGGFAINVGSDVKADGIIVENNRADGIGGGIYNRGRLELTNSEIRANATNGNGGGIGTFKTSSIPLSKEAGLFVTDTLITDNRAMKGAGCYLHVGCVSQLTGVTIEKNVGQEEGSGIYANGQTTLTDVTITGNTAATDLYALYFDASLYDGHTYYTGKKVLQGKILVKDNQGGDAYLGEGAAIAIPGAGLAEGTYLPLDLHSGVLTQQVIGVYNYEGENLKYLITAGDRSVTDPETPVKTAQQQETPAEAGDVVLYVVIGVFAAAVIAVAAVVIAKKKKKTPAVGNE